MTKLQLDVEGETLELNPGRTRDLNLSYFPEWSTDFTMRWYSTDRSIAKFNAGNRIEALKEGTVDLSIVSKEGISTGCKLIVSDNAYNPVAGIKISHGSSNVGYVGETMACSAEVQPRWATSQNVDWSSSDESIATISSDGVITFLSPGKVRITATAQDESGVIETVIIVSRQITDLIDVENCISKFTRKGWSSSGWIDDLDATAVMPCGNYFKYSQGLGYYFASFTSPNQHNYASVDFDTTGDWTVSERFFAKKGQGVNSTAILEAQGNDTHELLRIMLMNSGKTTFQLSNSSGDSVFRYYALGDAVIELDEDNCTAEDTALNFTLVHTASGTHRCYVNGVLLFEGTDLVEMTEMLSPKIYIGSKPGNTKQSQYYQALVLYQKAMNEREVLALSNAFDLMFE